MGVFVIAVPVFVAFMALIAFPPEAGHEALAVGGEGSCASWREICSSACRQYKKLSSPDMYVALLERDEVYKSPFCFAFHPGGYLVNVGSANYSKMSDGSTCCHHVLAGMYRITCLSVLHTIPYSIYILGTR